MFYKKKLLFDLLLFYLLIYSSYKFIKLLPAKF